MRSRIHYQKCDGIKRSLRMQEVGCWNPGCNRLQSFKKVVTFQLSNVEQNSNIDECDVMTRYSAFTYMYCVTIQFWFFFVI